MSHAPPAAVSATILIYRSRTKRIVAARRHCPLGEAWFLADRARTKRSRQLQVVRRRSTWRWKKRRGSWPRHYPLIYGLNDTSCEAQRIAVADGGLDRANVDTTTSLEHGLSGMAFSGVGEVTCTLGEVRHRGDLVIFWGIEPSRESSPPC